MGLLEAYYGAVPVDAASRAAIQTQLLQFKGTAEAWPTSLHWLETRCAAYVLESSRGK